MGGGKGSTLAERRRSKDSSLALKSIPVSSMMVVTTPSTSMVSPPKGTPNIELIDDDEVDALDEEDEDVGGRSRSSSSM